MTSGQSFSIGVAFWLTTLHLGSLPTVARHWRCQRGDLSRCAGPT